MVGNKVLTVLQDNQGQIGLVQYLDMNKAKSESSGNSILFKFLHQRLRLENILHLTQYIVQNSTYSQASRLDAQIRERRIIRNIVCTIEQVGLRPQHTSRGSGAKPKAGKARRKSISNIIQKFRSKQCPICIYYYIIFFIYLTLVIEVTLATFTALLFS